MVVKQLIDPNELHYKTLIYFYIEYEKYVSSSNKKTKENIMNLNNASFVILLCFV